MKLFIILLFIVPNLAYPALNNHESAPLEKRTTPFEWTAWGDSYASGVGTGDYLDGRRCLRHNGAYPELIHHGSGSGVQLNNVVCTDQTSPQPDWQYWPRPAAGNSTLRTLTVGGDDIDFPGILNNCILDRFPYPMNKGFVPRSCDAQKDLSWSLVCQNGDKDMPNDGLVSKVDSVIKKIIKYGQGATGKAFRPYQNASIDCQDSGIDTSPSNPRVPSKKYGWLRSQLPHIRRKYQPERPRNGEEHKYEQLGAKCAFAPYIRFIDRWHYTSLKIASNDSKEGEERIDDADVKVAVDIEYYVFGSTSYNNIENRKEPMKDPKHYRNPLSSSTDPGSAP
ncbi:hypothetical protein BTUL_0154g00070 [Botrytis tulipae]|uniref:SGNH hydrolase-type esterase domain-containing protein n=1 Tax=Botrytis tulipae TaxID=87230 RepID=A0A4Z1EBT0_9HELO|nr:hypothetical protein BTUL_0154g00070 [Botrytis tulipae]